MGVKSPKTIGWHAGGAVQLRRRCRRDRRQGEEAGATIARPVENRFYGDRVGQIEDPFGHVWSIQTHIEDVSPDEMRRRAAAEAGGD